MHKHPDECQSRLLPLLLLLLLLLLSQCALSHLVQVHQVCVVAECSLGLHSTQPAQWPPFGGGSHIGSAGNPCHHIDLVLYGLDCDIHIPSAVQTCRQSRSRMVTAAVKAHVLLCAGLFLPLLGPSISGGVCMLSNRPPSSCRHPLSVFLTGEIPC